MSFTLKIETKNAAFADEDGGDEIARLLRELADRLARAPVSRVSGVLFDINGNTVGTWRMQREAVQ